MDNALLGQFAQRAAPLDLPNGGIHLAAAQVTALLQEVDEAFFKGGEVGFVNLPFWFRRMRVSVRWLNPGGSIWLMQAPRGARVSSAIQKASSIWAGVRAGASSTSSSTGLVWLTSGISTVRNTTPCTRCLPKGTITSEPVQLNRPVPQEDGNERCRRSAGG